MAKKTKRLRQQPRAQRAKTRNPSTATQPFSEHLRELRKRLFYIAVSVFLLGGTAYAFERQIVDALLKPAQGQQFIYTSPGGGVSFLFNVCLYAGVALSIPVIIYQVLSYMRPLLREESRHFIAVGSTISGILALIGMTFGYFVGLPNALHFLLHQFVTQQIRPLVTIQSYMSFVAVYMLGSALLLQAPLILLFINRIKPLKPGGLFKAERWVIVGAFVAAGLMNPTPNLLAQMIVVGPLIAMYQVGIGLIWYVNRHGYKPAFVAELLAKDAEEQAARYERFLQSHRLTPEPLEQPNQQVKVAKQQSSSQGSRSILVNVQSAPRKIIISERPHAGEIAPAES